MAWARAVCLALMLLLPSVSADWQSFHGDARNTGYDGTDYDLFREVWWSVGSAAQGAFVEASPIASDGKLVLADHGGNIRVLDIESGNQIWQAQMSKIVGTPAIASGRLFVADTAGLLHSYQLETGVLLEAVEVGPTRSGITAAEGKVILGTEAGQIKAYEASSLTLLWTFSIDKVHSIGQRENKDTGKRECVKEAAYAARPVRTAPALYADMVFVGAYNNLVIAVRDEGNGDGTTDLMWHSETGDFVQGSPAVDVDNNLVIVGSQDGNVYGFHTAPLQRGADPCSGYIAQPRWTFRVPEGSRVTSSPALDDEHAYFGTNGGSFYAIKKQTGSIVWGTTLGEAVTSSPAVAGDYVVVATDEPTAGTFWLHRSNGTVAAHFAMRDNVKASPAIVDSKVFVSEFDGATYAFGPTIPARPDLVITAVENAFPGLNIVVTNRGNAEAKASNVKLHVAGRLVADLGVPELAPGQSQTLLVTENVPAGEHQVRVDVDTDERVDESDESNNRFDQAINIGAAPAPPPRRVPGFGLGLAIIGLAMWLRRQ